MPSYDNTIQYAVHTESPDFKSVLEFVYANNLKYEIHLARTRFWVPKNTPQHTEFMLRFYHSTSEVKE